MSLCILTRALTPETSASDMGCGLIMHCSIAFCNTENDRKKLGISLYQILRHCCVEKCSLLMCAETRWLCISWLERQCTQKSAVATFYAEEVKETLLNNRESLKELPKSGLNLSPALESPWSCLGLSYNSSHGKWHFSVCRQEMLSGNQQTYASISFL